jgi:hypothetical protein
MKIAGIGHGFYETAIAKGEVAMIEMWWDPVLFEQELNRLEKIDAIDAYSSIAAMNKKEVKTNDSLLSDDLKS